MNFDINSLNWANVVVFMGIALLAGWVASRVVSKQGGFNWVGNLIIGCIGSLLGSYLFRYISSNWQARFGQFTVSLLGATVLIYLLRLIKTKG